MENFNPSSRVNPVSKRVTRQEGLSRGGSVFHGNAYRRLIEEGFPFAVIQPGLETNPGSC